MATAGTSNNTSATPIGYGTLVGTTPIIVLPSNPSCGGVIFMNNGNVQIAICPAVVNQGVAGVFAGPATGVPAISGPGSKNLNPGDVFIVDNLLCTTAFIGVAAAAGAVLTVWTF